MSAYRPNIDLFLSDEEKSVAAAAREFADARIAPLAAEIDRKEEIPRPLLAEMARAGFMGVLIPREFGGSGLTVPALFLIQVEINRVCASTGITMSVHNTLVASPILKHGSPELKQRFLPKLASAEWIGAYSLSEPGSGSDAASLSTSAERKGDRYVLRGQKVFVTNGGFANLFVVFARTNPNADTPARGISCFLVPRDTPGLTVGRQEKKLGIRGSSTVQIFLDDAEVPEGNRLGPEGAGFKIAMETLDGGRIGVCAQSCGIALAALHAALKYSQERKAFGRRILDFQAIQWKLADMATDTEAALLLGLRAARLREAGEPHTREASMAKLFASTMLNRHANEALQIHGGAGYLKDFPVERYFRDARITEIYEGTSEIQRMVISRSLVSSGK